MDLKLPYGLKNDKLIHIKELDKDESGLACNCFCPNCNSQLIARMGNKRVNHFAHYNSNCSYSVESTLHFLAKEILEKRCELRIPKVVANYKGKDYLLIQEKILKFDRVILEKHEGDIIPDIICFVGDEKIYVEIAVTHYVDNEKLNKIENKDITTLEIDLSSLWEESTNEDFMKATEKKNVENLIVDTTANKKWVFHADINKFLNNLIIEEERILKEKEEKYNSIYEFVLEILKEEKKIILPSVKTNDTKPKLLYKEKIINFDIIKLLTKNEDSIQLVCIKGTRKLYIEVYLGQISNNKSDNYFSFMNDKYQEYYKNKNSAIMIDLRRLINQDNFILKDQNKLELKQEVLFKNSYKKWIYNYKSFKKEQELLNTQEKKAKEKKELKKKRLAIAYSQKKMKKKRWSQAFEESYKYDNLKKLLNINGKFPEYLNQEIKDSIVIECDQREWQSLLFYTYIVKWRKKDQKTSPHFSVKHVIEYLKKSREVRLNFDMIYMKNIEKYKNRNGLAEVIYEFFKGLEKKHFVNEKRPISGPAYHRWFTRLTKKEELNEIEYHNFKNNDIVKIDKNEDISFLNLEELFGDISEVENPQVKVKRKKRSSNSEEAEKKEKLVNLLTQKFGYCKICGKYTNAWRSFTPPDTCECYCNFEKEKEEAIKAKEMRDKENNMQSDKKSNK